MIKLNGFFFTDKQQRILSRQPHVELVNDNTTKVMTTPVSVKEKKHLDEQESDEASETDCSTELIPQALEGNKLPHIPKSASVDTQKVDNPNLTTKNMQDKKELKKKESKVVFSDSSSLSDTDSDTITTNKAVRGGGKSTGDEPKSSPKKKTVKKATEEQVK